MIHIIVSYDKNISWIIFVKMDSMSGCDIRLVFIFPPKDSTLQYKKCVHLWNNYLCIIILWFLLCILCVHIETSSLWAAIVNKNRRISVCLVSEEDKKAFNFDNLIIHIIVSYDQNISLIFYVKDGSHFRLWHPSCVYITTQRQYTAVQKMRTPLK